MAGAFERAQFFFDLGGLIRQTRADVDEDTIVTAALAELKQGRVRAGAANPYGDGKAAERIVEEELLSWQSSEPASRASVAPLSNRDLDLFAAEEAHSVIRLRAARVLTKLRTA